MAGAYNGGIDPMDRIKGMATGIIMAIILLLLLSTLTGCKTRRLVQKETNVDSTAIVSKSVDSTSIADSVRTALSHSTKDSTTIYSSKNSDRNHEVKDSMDIRIVTEIDTVTNTVTNTIYTDRWHTDYLTERTTDTLYRDRIVVDSTSAYEWYKSNKERLEQTCDSLMSIERHDLVKTETVEVNRLKWWQKTLMYIGLAVLLVLLVWAGVKLYKNKSGIAKIVKYIIP